jgi:hypothetical protein
LEVVLVPVGGAISPQRALGDSEFSFDNGIELGVDIFCCDVRSFLARAFSTVEMSISSAVIIALLTAS